ncbi:unnamed protein product [Vicia faba]|uniref:Uncharacterized protein n=1 Tax=Vicia faba TaxID=3906 RepID=A0AAV0ZVD7_VICFA|nr:unnamed protein product [Vicia faba]
MKRKRNYVQVSQQLSVISPDLYLSDEYWECIFKFLNDDFNSLSVVSKQFLFITNRLRFSLTIRYPPDLSFLPFFIHLFQRFTNLTFIDFSRLSCDLDSLLPYISCFPLNITFLNLSNRSNFLANGLRAFSQNITCSNIDFDCNYDFFPLLQILDLSNMGCAILINSSRVKSIEFPKLEVLNLSRTRVDDGQFYIILKARPRLLQLSLNFCQEVTQQRVNLKKFKGEMGVDY